MEVVKGSDQWIKIDHLRGLTSVVDYSERDFNEQGIYFGDPGYRGNITGKLLMDLFNFYEPKHVTDPMAGSNTTGDVCEYMGIPYAGYDLNPYLPTIDRPNYLLIGGRDVRKGEFERSTDMMILHIPYFNIIEYSKTMWHKSRWGRGKPVDYSLETGHEKDLSVISDYKQFIHEMNRVIMHAMGAVRKGGRLVLIVADVKLSREERLRRGEPARIYPIAQDLSFWGTPEQNLIKVQNNMLSNRKDYGAKTGKKQRFIPIVHEYVIVIRKDDFYVLPMRYVQIMDYDARRRKHATWRSVVTSAMEALGAEKHPVSLESLYHEIEGHERCKTNPFWKEKVRQTLQRYSKEYEPVGNGLWRLRPFRDETA